jgi:hypothetical protein
MFSSERERFQLFGGEMTWSTGPTQKKSGKLSPSYLWEDKSILPGDPLGFRLPQDYFLKRTRLQA